MISLQQSNRGPVTDRHSRHGFTLIELLMVIVIIGILISLLLPAISSVRNRAKVTEVKVEIDNLASALADFKAKFGFYPPSKIVLTEDPSNFSWPSASRAVIRRMFPQFNFKVKNEIDGDLNNTSGFQSERHTLTGAECLVFFLGGVQDENGVPIGFSSNPSRPFLASGGNRIGPLFDFDAGRVQETDVDGDGMKEYVSPLSAQTTPYLYVSAYDGRGYASPNISPFDKDPSPPPEITVNDDDLDVFPEAIQVNNNWIENPDNMKFVYLQGSTPWKPKSFQIICPGFDDQYGTGGIFAEESAKENIAPEDYDNITNFYPGEIAL
jgi:prepilin-type N-terminal cleavage/methylation domain-containing protein